MNKILPKARAIPEKYARIPLIEISYHSGMFQQGPCRYYRILDAFVLIESLQTPGLIERGKNLEEAMRNYNIALEQTLIHESL